MTALLEVEDLRVAYGKIEAVKGISFKVDAGEVVTLIGTNGICTNREDESGKTALMIMWYMRSGYQGRGLFSGLVKAGIDWAEAEPRFERICVNHRDGNEASRKSNQKHGFTYIGQDPWTWPDGKTADLVMYERRFER